MTRPKWCIVQLIVSNICSIYKIIYHLYNKSDIGKINKKTLTLYALRILSIFKEKEKNYELSKMRFYHASIKKSTRKRIYAMQ